MIQNLALRCARNCQHSYFKSSSSIRRIEVVQTWWWPCVVSSQRLSQPTLSGEFRSPAAPTGQFFHVGFKLTLFIWKEMIKNTLMEALNHTAKPMDGPHADGRHSLHCIDWIRQALMCNADLTLDAIGDGQSPRHQCRNFRMIWEWTQQNGYSGSLDELGHVWWRMQFDKLSKILLGKCFFIQLSFP